MLIAFVDCIDEALGFYYITAQRLAFSNPDFVRELEDMMVTTMQISMALQLLKDSPYDMHCTMGCHEEKKGRYIVK